ncbi:39S ribosomal protein L48, mitochondrial [Neodiprion fabricii]|uniref:39S ribosomal protein L48, mitochondrial n=1 Tax=Neodiprion fabricii TaxID=2872261 RepID=UPI001ED902CE|nr:39S ribosomal protein L48, mitochondrial [Neodiprion fabricii]
MALRILRKVVKSTLRPQVGSSFCRSYSLYEPDYLEVGKSKIPMHDVLNIQLTAYNFCTLESYHHFLDNLIQDMGIEVETSWALPPKHEIIQKFKPRSTVIDSEYKLKTYFRSIQVVQPPSTLYPILLRMIDASLPEGVTVNVVKHEPEHEEIRHVPNKDLMELKEQLDMVGKTTGKKKKGF